MFETSTVCLLAAVMSAVTALAFVAAPCDAARSGRSGDRGSARPRGCAASRRRRPARRRPDRNGVSLQRGAARRAPRALLRHGVTALAVRKARDATGSARAARALRVHVANGPREHAEVHRRPRDAALLEVAPGVPAADEGETHELERGSRVRHAIRRRAARARHERARPQREPGGVGGELAAESAARGSSPGARCGGAAGGTPRRATSPRRPALA